MSLAVSIVSGNLKTASVPFTHIWQSSLRLWEPIKKTDSSLSTWWQCWKWNSRNWKYHFLNINIRFLNNRIRLELFTWPHSLNKISKQLHTVIVTPSTLNIPNSTKLYMPLMKGNSDAFQNLVRPWINCHITTS